MTALDDAYEAASRIVAERDRDRWLASLFVPGPLRRHVLALYAFSAEIAAVRDHVSAPMPGEIRLQWWREVLTGAGRGDISGHPVAAALLDTIARFRLPVAPFLALIDARVFDLYDDPMPAVNDLEGYFGETTSVLFQLAALILADGRDPGTADLAGHAGVAYGLTGMMRALGRTAARGQCFLPLDRLTTSGSGRDDVVALRPAPGVLVVLDHLRAEARRHLAEARRLLAAAPTTLRPAFLPLVLVEPKLRALERRAHTPFANDLGIAAWRRPLALWWSARRL